MALLAVAAVLLVLVAGTAPSASDGAVTDEQRGFASWSGAAAGTDGACGYGDNVAKNVPFMGLVAGLGGDHGNCGICYRVICTHHDACSTAGVRVTVTDMCRGAPCAQARGNNLFEMTEDAFGAMAQPGRADELRTVGMVSVLYKWEDCYYSPMPPNYNFPAFRVYPGSTKEDFAVTVVFINGMAAGNAVTVQIKNKGDRDWHKMTWTGGATWKHTSQNTSLVPLPVTAPMSMKVSMPWLSDRSPKVEEVTADDVIPAGWQPGQTYYPRAPTPSYN